MAAKPMADLDFLGIFATRHRLEDPVSSDPSGLGSGDQSRVWFNTTTKKWMYWNGTAGIDPVARANHTGTQLSSTISDLATTVQAYSLSLFAAPTGDLSIGTHKLTNVTDPVNPQDGATKNYVDNSIAGIAGGLILKGAVACAPTTNISISSPGATIDGVTMTNPMVILLTGQTTTSQNGPYVWTGPSTALTRATNFATSAEAVLGSFWLVEQGSNAGSIATLSNSSAITLGTTALTFSFNPAGGSSVTGSSSILISGGAASVITGTGMIGDATHVVAPDFTIVGRKVTGAIPTSTTGIVAVSGSAVTINHGLNNSAPMVIIAVGATAYTGYTTGDIIGPGLNGFTVQDANNVVGSLPAAPASGNWLYTVVG